MSTRNMQEALIKEASEPYRKADLSGYFKARGKLRGDPAFVGILSAGLLARTERILDLGCGQGLLAAWLDSARRRQDEAPHLWPREWKSAPRLTSYRGIELRRHDIWRARIALGARAEFEVGDITKSEYGSVDAVVLLDVLHYLERRAQVQVLDQIREALPTDGLLLLRVGDAHGGIRFSVGKWIDGTVMLACYHQAPRMYFRPLQEWLSLLTALGFQIEALPMSTGTPFANTLLVARARKKAHSARHLKDTLLTQ